MWRKHNDPWEKVDNMISTVTQLHLQICCSLLLIIRRSLKKETKQNKKHSKRFYSALIQEGTAAQRSCGAPSLGALKARLDGDPGQLRWWGAALPMARGWDLVGFEVPSYPNHSMVLWWIQFSFIYMYKHIISMTSKDLVSKISNITKAYAIKQGWGDSTKLLLCTLCILYFFLYMSMQQQSKFSSMSFLECKECRLFLLERYHFFA